MNEESFESIVEVYLTRSGRLPNEIRCPNCGATARRLRHRKVPIYRCEACEADTTLEHA